MTARREPTPICPADDRRILTLLLYNLPNVPGLNNIHGGMDRAAHLLTEVSRLAGSGQQMSFRWLGDTGPVSRFEIGRQGTPPRVVKTRCSGVWAVWWLLAHPGDCLRTSDLSAPHIDDPDASVRRQIRATAAAEFAAWGFAELEAAALCCTVSGGFVEMQLPVSAPRFLCF